MTARRRPRALALTCPGGPRGWPGTVGGLSYDEALVLLGRRRPGPLYVIGIDQAKHSGLAVHDTRKVVMHGAARSTLDKVDQLERMRTLPGWDWQRTLVVFEDHENTRPRDRSRYTHEHGAPKRHAGDRDAIRLGRAWGHWDALLDLRNQPQAQRILAEPSEWRRVLSGCRFGAGDDWKSAALRWAQSTIDPSIDDDDEAEACAIATWGAIDGLYRWATQRLAEQDKRREAP